MFLQLFHADERLSKFALRASGLELISSNRLNSRKVMLSPKSVWPTLHSRYKIHVLPPLEGNNKDLKKNRERWSNIEGNSLSDWSDLMEVLRYIIAVILDINVSFVSLCGKNTSSGAINSYLIASQFLLFWIYQNFVTRFPRPFSSRNVF